MQKGGQAFMATRARNTVSMRNELWGLAIPFFFPQGEKDTTPVLPVGCLYSSET